MEMFLMALCITVFGMGVAAAAFGAATRSERPDSPAQSQPQLPLAWTRTVAPTRFFSDTVPAPPAIPTKQLPIGVLLLQIENHVRMEQAAAESFLEFPTQAKLHSKTNSPFVN